MVVTHASLEDCADLAFRCQNSQASPNTMVLDPLDPSAGGNSVDYLLDCLPSGN